MRVQFAVEEQRPAIRDAAPLTNMPGRIPAVEAKVSVWLLAPEPLGVPALVFAVTIPKAGAKVTGSPVPTPPVSTGLLRTTLPPETLLTSAPEAILTPKTYMPAATPVAEAKLSVEPLAVAALVFNVTPGDVTGVRPGIGSNDKAVAIA